MKGYLRSLALVGVFLSLATSIGFASAANIYIAQNAVGSANGTDCANAYGVNFFNASGDWGVGTGQIGPGTTVHLCGTFTGTPGSTMLTVQGSGANGSPVTIKFESGAILAAPYWSSSRGAINLNRQSYIVIDGGTNGIIENTANGTGLAYQSTSAGIYAGGTSNCEVKNLTIKNIYVHTSTSDTAVHADNSNAVLFYPPVANLTIDNNTVHDCGNCLWGYGNGIRVHNNVVYNMNEGVIIGVDSGSYSGISIYNNHFYDMVAWDTSSDTYHHEAIHAYGQGGSITGLDIYNNLADGDPGANASSWIYLEHTLSNVHVFNNVLIYPSGRYAYNGLLTFGGTSTQGGTNDQAYNNVMIDHNGTSSDTKGLYVNYQVNFTAKNNIMIGSNTALRIANSTVANMSNNVYENAAADFGSSSTFIWGGTHMTSLSDWQSTCGCDFNSLIDPASQIGLGSDGQLGSSSVAIGAGTNLTSLGIGSLDKDKIGVQRPSSGPWDAGAYVYGSNTAGPSPPSGLTASAH